MPQKCIRCGMPSPDFGNCPFCGRWIVPSSEQSAEMLLWCGYLVAVGVGMYLGGNKFGGGAGGALMGGIVGGGLTWACPLVPRLIGILLGVAALGWGVYMGGIFGWAFLRVVFG